MFQTRGLFVILFSLVIASSALYAERIRKIEVYPSSVKMEAGKELQFTVVAFDSQGYAFTPSRVSWNTNGGRVSHSGLFTAGRRSGYFRVTAKMGRLRGSASVHIKDSGPNIHRIEVRPERVRIEVGERIRFSAYAYDRRGRQVSFTPRWYTGERRASINRKGVFYASSPGRYTVIAEDPQSQKSGRAEVIVKRKHDDDYQPYPMPGPGNGYEEARIHVHDWDVGGGNFFRPSAKIHCTVYGSRVQTAKLYAIYGGGRQVELQTFSCKHGDTVKFRTKYSIGATSVEIRLYDNRGRVLARHGRRL